MELLESAPIAETTAKVFTPFSFARLAADAGIPKSIFRYRSVSGVFFFVVPMQQ